jgi:hypothetical protein
MDSHYNKWGSEMFAASHKWKSRLGGGERRELAESPWEKCLLRSSFRHWRYQGQHHPCSNSEDTSQDFCFPYIMFLKK